MPLKNNAVKVTIVAWDTNNNIGKTGDSGNITVRGVGDGTEYTPSSPAITEIDATNMKGVYSVSLTAGENNYSFNTIAGVSATANVVIIPVSWSNEMNANLTQVNGAAQTATLDTVKADTVSILSKVLKYFQLIMRKDAAIGTDNVTELTAINANGGSGAGTYSNQTDSVEAILDGLADVSEVQSGLATSAGIIAAKEEIEAKFPNVQVLTEAGWKNIT